MTKVLILLVMLMMMIIGSIYCILIIFQASFKALYVGYFISFFPQTYVWVLYLIFILERRKLSTLSSVTEPVSYEGGLESRGLILLPFLLAELNKPRIYLLVDVHDEEVKPKPLAGILKSRAKHMDFLRLQELLTFSRVKVTCQAGILGILVSESTAGNGQE